ncbi:MAG: hypothetical protein ABI451_06780 [Dokdonella sp.]
MNLLDEVKRRKVFKVGAGYVVVAWLAIQAVSIGFPAFDAPPWALRVFILIALLGFPLTLVMAWMFDATPAGVKFDPDVRGSKRIYAIAAVLAVLALGWYFYGQPSFRKGDSATPTAASDPHSIAVLPFQNMSGDPKQEYFSDGMTEELLDVLAKVPQLKVVARTSVFAFKGKGEDVREIGRKLDVANIVEGSVRRDGQQVRVTAQLVRVSDGFHVWSETYDRQLEGVFALQDDIARHVADALKQSLGVVAAVPVRAPIDPAAYDDYLRGRALLRQRNALPQAIDQFSAAVAKAPQFAEGWSSLSLAEGVIYWYVRMDRAQAVGWLAKAADAAAHAAALAPDSAATEHALANVARERFAYAEAERHYLRAIAIDPGYPDAREDYSEMLNLVGRVGDAAAAIAQLVRLDPYFIVGWMRRFDAAVASDNRKEVELALARIRELDAKNVYSIFGALNYALAYSRKDEARKAARDIQDGYPAEGRLAQTLLPWALGAVQTDPHAAEATLDALPAIEVPGYLIVRQDIAAYLDYVSHAGPMDQTYFFFKLYRSKPNGHAMLRDPRIKAKLIDYGFVAYWRKQGWPVGCRALGDADFECGLDAAWGH